MKCIFCSKEIESKKFYINVVSDAEGVKVIEDNELPALCQEHAEMMLNYVKSQMSGKNVMRHRNAVEKKERANELRKEGKSIECIAEELGIAVAAVKQYTGDYTTERTRKIEQYIGEGLTVEEIANRIDCDLGMTRRLVGTAKRLMALRAGTVKDNN